MTGPGVGQVKVISQAKSPFMYVKAMSGTTQVSGDSFSGLGTLFSGCLPGFNPSLIQGFEVRLSESLSATQVPALLKTETAQRVIQTGVAGISQTFSTQKLSGDEGIDTILENVGKVLFIHPDHTDLGPVVDFQFTLPAKGGKASLIIDKKPKVSELIVEGTFKKLSEKAEVEVEDLDELQRQAEGLKKRVAEIEETNRALKTENSTLTALRKKLSEMEGELQDLRTQAELSKLDKDLADKVPALREGLKQANEAMIKLRAELKAREDTIERRDITIGEKTTEIERVNGELGLARAEAKRLEGEVEKTEKEIQSGVKEIERLTKLLDEAVRERERIRLEKERLESKVPESESQAKRLAELTTKEAAANAQVERLNKALEESVAQKEKLLKENGELRSRAVNAERRVAELEAELKVLKETTLPGLKKKLAEATSKVEEQKKSLERLGKEVSQMRSELEQEKSKTGQASGQLENIKKLLEETNKVKAELERKIQEIESKAPAGQREL